MIVAASTIADGDEQAAEPPIDAQARTRLVQ
jgi:hypothetical protein